MRRKWTDFVRAFSALIFAVALPSCQGEIIEKQHVAHEVGFYAGDGLTRTTMLSDGLSAVWEAGDQLAVWAEGLSSGSYAFSNQIFKTYGLDDSFGFFTSTINETMDEDAYWYYCCYPVPLSVSGTKATFEVPAIQDGKVSGGAGILIAEPVKHGPLTAVPDPEDHTGMSMTMKHMLHQFRFFIPGDNTVIGNEKLERIVLTFPSEVCGRVTMDVKNPYAAPVLNSGTRTADLRLAEPLGISNPDVEYACFAFVPQTFSEGQLQIKAYTSDRIAHFDPIDLSGKVCLPGHSTPVSLKVKEIADYPYHLTFKLAQNNLGEDPNTIVLTAPSGCRWTDDGSNVYTYTPGKQIVKGDAFTIWFEDEAQFKAFSGKDISVTYDSDNTLTYQTVRVSDLTSKNSTEVSLTVPYLFFEDFSNIPTFNDGHDNIGVGGTASDSNYKEIHDLSSHTSYLSGWYGTRIGGSANKAVRVCCRYEHVLLAGAYYKGRIYTPFFTNIKEGKDVKISISFKYGGDRSERKTGGILGIGGSLPKKSPMLYFGVNSEETVTNPDKIEGDIMDSVSGLYAGTGYAAAIPTSLSPMLIRGEALSVGYSYTSLAGTKTITLDGVDNHMRLGWIISTDSTESNTHANYWLYLDDIKVQIVR